MFPAQQTLGKQQFAVDTDNVEQLLAAGTDVMGNRLQPGGGQAVRQRAGCGARTVTGTAVDGAAAVVSGAGGYPGER